MISNKRSLPLLLFVLATNLFAQKKDSVVYKKIDTTSLSMEIYYPGDYDPEQTYPAIVFFFGGGWLGGNTKQFEPHAKYFSKRGMVCFLADYRVKRRQNTTPFESLMDAKSAIRYIRKNALKFSVAPSKIVAAGGSAGGQLAAATALTKKYNEEGDNLSVSCKPNALLLFNPVIDNGPGGYGYERIGKEYKDFSPLHNINVDAPPTIILLGTKDNLIPVETAEYYKTVMEKVESRCDLILYKGQEHGFFNYDHFDNYKKTVLRTDRFLQSIGYLESYPVVEIERSP